MAGVLEVTVDALTAATDLDRTADRLADLTPVWEGSADPALRGMFRATFETEGAFIGRPWAKLSATTLALKQRFRRGNKGILRFTDDLFRSLTVRSGANQHKVVTPTSLTLGTNDPKASLHQTGWVSTSIFGRPRKQPIAVPARPVVPDEIPPTVLETIERSMASYVMSGHV